jgi:Protein of unknown function (DUF2637)
MMTTNTAALTGLALRPSTGLADSWLRRLVTTIVAAMTGVVVIVAVLAFLASFGAIHDFALRSGGIAAAHVWMAPLFVDSFVFIGACGDLFFALVRTGVEQDWRGRAMVWSPKLLLIAAAVGSFGLNIAHAPATPAARVVAALPPTALVVTEIILMIVIRGAATLRAARIAAGLVTVTRDGDADLEQEQPATPAGQPAEADRDLRAQARELIGGWQAAGVAVTGAQLAAQLSTSPRHGRRLLAEYRASHTAVSNNGDHPHGEKPQERDGG